MEFDKDLKIERELLLNYEKLSEVLNIPVATLRTWKTRHPERLPKSIKLGVCTMFHIQDVIEFCNNLRQAG